MSSIPRELWRRQPGGEEARFRWAFAECLRLRPNKAPSPTDLNILLEKPPPLNILSGRLSRLRRELLVSSGFIQDAKFGRWRRENVATHR